MLIYGLSDCSNAVAFDAYLMRKIDSGPWPMCEKQCAFMGVRSYGPRQDTLKATRAVPGLSQKAILPLSKKRWVGSIATSVSNESVCRSGSTCLVWYPHSQPLVSNMNVHRRLTLHLSIKGRILWISTRYDR
jgi:hypothetical protein